MSYGIVRIDCFVKKLNCFCRLHVYNLIFSNKLYMTFHDKES